MIHVYEACDGSRQVEVPPPINQKHLQAIRLLGDAQSKQVKSFNKKILMMLSSHIMVPFLFAQKVKATFLGKRTVCYLFT